MKQTILSVIFVVVFAAQVKAWPTRLYSDAEVTERAELIVRASIKEGSIKKVFVRDKSSYEHHAILIVSNFLKGKFHERELPITIGYGLLPVSARQEKYMLPDEDATKRSRPEEPGEATKIYEDNPSMGFGRSSGDVHQEQIWLLHRLGPSRDKDDLGVSPANSIGISAPEDIQPLSKEQSLSKRLRAP